MKPETLRRAKKIKAALLALPEETISALFEQWLDLVAERMVDWSDDFRFALGYELESEETEHHYLSWEEFLATEDETASVAFIPPTNIKEIIDQMNIQDFYHQVIGLAGEALHNAPIIKLWGYPPSSISDGYQFMDNLFVYLKWK
jgi:hypothetical protein